MAFAAPACDNSRTAAMDKSLPKDSSPKSKPPKRQRTAVAPAPPAADLPSREAILDYVARESERGAKIGKREIARAFAVKGADRIGLKRLIKDMEADGLLDRRRKAIAKAGELHSMQLAEIAGQTKDGDLFAVPTEWNGAARGEAPKILVKLPRRGKSAERAPGLRDTVLLRLERGSDPHFPYTGHVIKIVPRERRARSACCASSPTGPAVWCRSTRRRKGASWRLPRPISAMGAMATSSRYPRSRSGAVSALRAPWFASGWARSRARRR